MENKTPKSAEKGNIKTTILSKSLTAIISHSLIISVGSFSFIFSIPIQKTNSSKSVIKFKELY